MKTHKKAAIIMLGAPGSGKGTQGKLLEDETGFKRYVMSDMIKDELKPGTALYDNVMNKGVLLNDSDVFHIFRRYFKSEDTIIIDGLPRTLDQAYWLYGFLTNHQYEITLIFLNVNQNNLLKRVTSRYYCPKCHRLYNTHIAELIPKVNKKCDDDGFDLIQREDDTAEIFTQRLELFNKVKEIILDVYRGDIVEINGDRDIKEVNREILNKIIS